MPAGDELKRAVIMRIIDTLRDRGVSFRDAGGIRPQSYYEHLRNIHLSQHDSEIRFARYVWDMAGCRPGIIPDEADNIENMFDTPDIPPEERSKLAAEALLEKDFVGASRQQLEAVTNYADLYGLWVESLKSGEPNLDLVDAVEAWVEARMPLHCLQQMNLVQVTNALVESLKWKIKDYLFNEDLLLAWMAPNLADDLIDLLQPCRPQITPELRACITERAGQIIDNLYESFGIYDLEAEEIARRTVFFVITANQAEYNAHQHRICEWTAEVLKKQIKLIVRAYCQPRMDMRAQWGATSERVQTGELRKREVFLRKFLSILRV